MKHRRLNREVDRARVSGLRPVQPDRLWGLSEHPLPDQPLPDPHRDLGRGGAGRAGARNDERDGLPPRQREGRLRPGPPERAAGRIPVALGPMEALQVVQEVVGRRPDIDVRSGLGRASV